MVVMVILYPAVVGILLAPIWLAFRSVSTLRTLEKHPVLVGLSNGLAVMLFLWIAGLAAIFAMMCFTGVGPEGRGSPIPILGTVAVLIGLLALSDAVLCSRLVFKAWRRFRQVCTWEWLKHREAKVEPEESYHGWRCVSCNEPITSETEICPQCGWTQPR